MDSMDVPYDRAGRLSAEDNEMMGSAATSPVKVGWIETMIGIDAFLAGEGKDTLRLFNEARRRESCSFAHESGGERNEDGLAGISFRFLQMLHE